MRRYAVAGTPTSTDLDTIVRAVAKEFEHDGFVRRRQRRRGGLRPQHVRRGAAKAFRRKARGTYSAAFYELDEEPEDVLKASYPMLVRTLSNVVLLHVPRPGHVVHDHGAGHLQGLRGPARDLRAPCAAGEVQLVIDNEFRPDLEPELWDGDEITIELSEAGKRMDDLDLLPAPFPVHEFLPERDLRHVMRLYQVGGLSYGNLSARKDENRFWMSASGVDKSQLETVGRDMLLVVDDEPNARIVLSVPPGNRAPAGVGRRDRALDDLPASSRRRRFSVHAWMEGIPATDVNYPCGTQGSPSQLPS